jgi:hypothetical protein
MEAFVDFPGSSGLAQRIAGWMTSFLSTQGSNPPRTFEFNRIQYALEKKAEPVLGFIQVENP